MRHEMDKSNGDLDGTAFRKRHLDFSDKKRTREFLGTIQPMFDHDLGKVTNIHDQIHGSIWIFYQVGNV